MYERMAIITPMLFYKHEQSMVPDNCINYEQNQHILLSNITSTQNWWKNGHNNSNLAESQILFDMHQHPKVPDHGTQYEENPSSHNGGMCEDGHPDFPIFPDSA